MRYAIYARYSSDLQSEHSIEDQVRLCRERIEQLGGYVGEIYTDAAISGAFVINRPGIRALLEDGRHGKFECVMAEALDRISRDQEDIAAIYKRLSHLDIKIKTLSEGEVSELHIGLKGTMNALFLKDMAAKVRRGQRGRLEDGLAPAGICYGYRPIHEMDSRGEVSRGKREIIEEQADIIRRIFEEYATGISPRVIAKRLNMEGIPSPRGGQWVASAINGSRARKSGILHNELYVGRMTYNRQTFRKDPDTGKRIPRLNPQSEWKTAEVPELRIIPDNLWDRVHAVKYQKGKNMPVHKTRRPKHLFSGLVHCGVCGGSYTVNGGTKLRCSRRRESGTCTNGRVVSIEMLETKILQGFERQLLSEEAFQHFVKTFNEERAQIKAELNKMHFNREKELTSANRRIKQVVNMMLDGMDSKALRAELMELEQRAETLEVEAKLDKATPANVIEIHPQLPNIYERKVKALRDALREGDISRSKAIEALRAMITDVTVKPGPKKGEVMLELHGSIPAVLAFASGKEGSKHDHTVLMVAAEGFEPPTKGL